LVKTSLASITRKTVLLQLRKQEAAKLRRKGEREFQKAKSLTNRSISGLVSLQRRIDSSKEQLDDVSGILTQRMAQHESIQRLIANAQENLRRENEAKEQAEQEVDFAESDEEKHQAIARLGIITERIDELVDEIKQRSKTAKKISQGIEDYNKSSTKLTSKIQKQTHSKPDLQKLIKTGRKTTIRLAKQIEKKAKQEESAKLNLSKISKKLSELASKRRKMSAKKKKSKPRKVKSKVRRIKTKTKKKSKVRRIKTKTKKKSKVRRIKTKTKKKSKVRRIKTKTKKKKLKLRIRK